MRTVQDWSTLITSCIAFSDLSSVLLNLHSISTKHVNSISPLPQRGLSKKVFVYAPKEFLEMGKEANIALSKLIVHCRNPLGIHRKRLRCSIHKLLRIVALLDNRPTLKNASSLLQSSNLYIRYHVVLKIQFMFREVCHGYECFLHFWYHTVPSRHQIARCSPKSLYAALGRGVPSSLLKWVPRHFVEYTYLLVEILRTHASSYWVSVVATIP